MMREESKASPIRSFGLSTVCLLLILCLTSCSTPPSVDDPQSRILSPLTPGEQIPYVKLSDGYLHFTERPARFIHADVSAPGEIGIITYEEAIGVLGFPLDEALSQLPEHLQLGAENLTEEDFILDETGSPFGGYEFSRVLESEYKVKPKLILKYDYRDRDVFHQDFAMFRIFPWERKDKKQTEIEEMYLGPKEYYKSDVGGLEVGVMYQNRPAAIAPEAPSEYYYAGFYVGDLAITLESHYSYCTQEEFIEVLLAIIDAAVAAQP